MKNSMMVILALIALNGVGQHVPTIPPPKVPVDGYIYKMDLTSITWYNTKFVPYTVQHRDSLTEGQWVDIGTTERTFVHNNPNGFYRVVLK